jgi:hypothetical protein
MVAALLVAPGASARPVRVHVNVKDQNGYRMSIEATRSARGVFGIATRKVTGGSEPAPLRALSRRQTTQPTRMAKAGGIPGIGVGDSDASGFLSVQVENRHAISTYGVRGTVTHNRLFGKLGDFGRISLHFHLHHSRTQHHGCNRVHERLGTFTGHVRFRGENGYVDVDTQRLRGKVELQQRRSRHCSFIRLVPPRPGHHKTHSKGRSDHRKTERYTLLYAARETESKSTLFAAFKENRERSAFYSDRFASHGPVLIDRQMFSKEGRAGDFKTSKGVTTARIKPSQNAFRGTGHYKGDHRWTGSLAASFPGARVGLAGRGFHAFLERYDRR